MDLEKLFESEAVFEQRTTSNERLERIFVRFWRVAGDLRRLALEPVADERSLREAILAARGQMVEILRLEDVAPFGKVGDAVDPRRHVVVGVEPDDAETPVVVRVDQEGLEWSSKVIQKADVIASR
jgi:molecular chaperone GrpE (heat shock protein)